MSDLEKKKKLLIAEGEVYRQTLKLEIQNLRIYTLKTRRKFTSFKVGNPALAFGIPVLMSLLAKKRRVRRWGALGFIGWQLYNRFGAALGGRFSGVHSRGDQTEAEEFLSTRM